MLAFTFTFTSCESEPNNDNPGINPPTEEGGEDTPSSFVVPDWAEGSYSGMIMNNFPASLNVSRSGFSINIDKISLDELEIGPLTFSSDSGYRDITIVDDTWSITLTNVNVETGIPAMDVKGDVSATVTKDGTWSENVHVLNVKVDTGNQAVDNFLGSGIVFTERSE